ncbi:MAG TPA: hypothetical protein VHR86_06810 [Armatimonadota bacterium]|nr:hypothetical protein [Armatimonadota bacterium]
MDKVVMNAMGGKEKALDPQSADVQQLKSALGQILHDAARPDEEKLELLNRLHAAHTREKLLELWQEITGEQL